MICGEHFFLDVPEKSIGVHWNRRPVEDALRERIAKLEAALKEIGEVLIDDCATCTKSSFSFPDCLSDGAPCYSAMDIAWKALEVGE